MTIKELFKTIKKDEWIFLLKLIFLLIFITSLPYLYGYLNKPANSRFIGTPTINWWDYLNYFSWIEQAKEGKILFKNFASSEPQRDIFFNLFFLFLGWGAKILNVSSLVIFQITRILLIPVFSIVSYLFISYFLKGEERKICFILLLFSSGLGVWATTFSIIFLKKAIIFPDLWVPEAISFLTLYLNSLHILSITLILLIFLLFLISLEEKRIKYIILAGFIFLFLSQIHPYTLPIVWSILGVYLFALFLLKKIIFGKNFFYYLILISFSLPSIFYWIFFIFFDNLSIERVSQAIEISKTPPLYSIIILFGVPFFLALIGFYNLVKNNLIFENKFLFLIAWSITQFCLIYLPYLPQRRFIEGLQVPIVILATIGVSFIYQLEKFREIKHFLFKNKIFWFIFFLLFLFLSNLVVIFNDIFLYTSKTPLFYLSQGMIKALDYLKENCKGEKVVLSSYYTGALIPPFAQTKAYIAHGGSDTLYFLEKKKKVEFFFGTNNYDSEKIRFLKENKIDYILFSEFERKMGDFNPYEKNYLEKVFEMGEVAIFKVNL
jgi:hypothetical protein